MLFSLPWCLLSLISWTLSPPEEQENCVWGGKNVKLFIGSELKNTWMDGRVPCLALGDPALSPPRWSSDVPTSTVLRFCEYNYHPTLSNLLLFLWEKQTNKQKLVLILNPARVVTGISHLWLQSFSLCLWEKRDCRIFPAMSLAALCNLCMIECQWSFVIWKAVFLFALSLVLTDSLV